MAGVRQSNDVGILRSPFDRLLRCWCRVGCRGYPSLLSMRTRSWVSGETGPALVILSGCSQHTKGQLVSRELDLQGKRDVSKVDWRL